MGKSSKWKDTVDMLLERSMSKGSSPEIKKVHIAEGAKCELP